jgi:SET domain-containing protein
MGVFSKSKFQPNEPILTFQGPVLEREEIPTLVNPEDDRYLQINKTQYLGPSGAFDDYINHSCNPNCGLAFQNEKIILKAIKPISPGEELTWDYSTTMDEEDWEMDCSCRAKQCRSRIRDFKTLPDHIKKKYKQLKIIPPFLLTHT